MRRTERPRPGDGSHEPVPSLLLDRPLSRHPRGCLELLILRDVFAGITRFDALARDLGISRKVLAARLDELVGHRMLETRAYSERPPRHDYVPTEKGADLYPVILALLVRRGAHPTAGS